VAANRVDAHARTLFAPPSRRALVGLGLSGVIGLLGFDRAGAGKKNRRKKRRNKQNGSTPVSTYACPGAPEQFLPSGGLHPRFAQRFTAGKNGQLRRITAQITKDGGSGDFIVQLVSVTGSPDGTPSHLPLDVLATTTIPNASVPTGEFTLTATFSGPEIVAGVEYAAVVGRRESTFSPGLRNDCDGKLFFAESAGPFTTPIEGVDLVVSVEVA
jgi:hypothetical protein